MAKFELKNTTTVSEFATAFNEAFGAQVRVKAFGEEFGYDTIQLSFNGDHLMLIGNGNTLLDQDINGESNEYIESIVDWTWIE